MITQVWSKFYVIWCSNERFAIIIEIFIWISRVYFPVTKWTSVTSIYLSISSSDPSTKSEISGVIWQVTPDVVQPKTPPFSTCHLIWVNCKVLSQLSQPIYLLFSYLNIARHNLVIGLCCEQFNFLFYVSRENQPKVFSLYIFCFFQ